MSRLVIHLDIPDVDPAMNDPRTIAEMVAYGTSAYPFLLYVDDAQWETS